MALLQSLLIALYSPNGAYDNNFLANYAYINLIDQLVRIPGIAQVNVFGAGQYAMRLWVKPDQLAKLDLTVSDIVQALQAQNAANPDGSMVRVQARAIADQTRAQFYPSLTYQGAFVPGRNELLGSADPSGQNTTATDVTAAPRN